MGVQDFNPEVQRLVNRIQPFEMTRDLTVLARELGFESVNYDLIYGLPAQTEGIVPPNGRNHHRPCAPIVSLSTASPLCPGSKKRTVSSPKTICPKGRTNGALYELAREMFLNEGYVELGLDHFSLPS